MDTNYLQLAVNNNAIWCDTVCRSHNIRGEFHGTFWMIKQQAPTYYPNLITLSPARKLDLHQDPLATFLSQQKDYTISVKDSFADLDLDPFGFHLLFEAQWIFLRSDSIAVLDQPSTELAWKRVVEEKELLGWEAAWSQTELTQNHIFLASLLHNADICIMAAYQDNHIVAGAIANKTPGVVGISNVFTPEQNAEQYWQGLLAMISKQYPGLPIVGYEHDESLALAIRVGFTILGPLRIWLKDE
ncbi:hypothetical protein [Dictyobacter aurantiacus]|uniref:N-acetyltransferase domain-containing protein n=1 Tax=Dictyobacter aurantiacus TaxID=1936993 RepID=A0A401ZDC6_9CHLR|nr:hypothetical protein [Dictyobacter aurantiacus]GCE04852.1 hypothetical protein KDAU_21810 [Dictyobacter aurantiacus]